MNAPIQTYLGNKVYKPADLTANASRWPSLNQLKKLKKQVIINGDYADDWEFLRFEHSYKSVNPDTCVVTKADALLQRSTSICQMPPRKCGSEPAKDGPAAMPPLLVSRRP